MFCQSQAYSTEISQKKRFFWLFISKKAKGVEKKSNWQLCCTRIENTHKVRKKTCNFLLCNEVQDKLVFLFPAETL